jgi:tetratricopeptide (TPR) repeat protein
MVTPMVFFMAPIFVTEESAALFQAATDEHWGADCSKLMKAVLVHNFDRHFQIARSTAFRWDILLVLPHESWSTEKTGNVQDCIKMNDRKNRAMQSYMRADPPPAAEVYAFVASGDFVGVEAHHQHLQPRQNFSRFFEYAGINNVQQAEEGYRSSAQFIYHRSTSKASADGLAHIYHEHAVVSQLRAVLSFSVAAHSMELSWLDDLPPANATTLHCTASSAAYATTARVLVAEVFEQQGRHEEAIKFVQADLQDYHNLNVPSKVRAGRVLGRCHAALGQHTLSVSAFDAAIDLARSRKLLLSEALSVRGRAAAGKNGAGNSRLHWDVAMGRQRLSEVMGRMQGPREALERALERALVPR